MQEKVLDYEIIENIELLWERDVIIYGTSSKAEGLYPLIKKSNINVVACCDGSRDKAGKNFHEWRIEHIEDVNKKIELNDVIVLICSNFVNEIISDCLEVNSKIFGFVTPFGFQYAFLINRCDLKGEFKSWYNEQYQMWLGLERDFFAHQTQADYIRNLTKMQKSDEVLVYTAGKVGSAGISNSLNKIGIKNMHLHFLNPSLNYISLDNSENYRKILKKIIEQKDKIKIITLVRDPVARDISGAFQSLPDPSRWMYRNLSKNLVDSFTNVLKESFYEIKVSDADAADNHAEKKKGIDTKGTKGFLFNWFDIELKDTFGIDVYAHTFDKERGYVCIKENNVECLVLKLEKLDECAKVVGDFVGVDGLEISHFNVGEDKVYKYVYKKFKEKFRVPQDMIDLYYDGEAIRHFYTEEEITRFRDRWS